MGAEEGAASENVPDGLVLNEAGASPTRNPSERDSHTNVWTCGPAATGLTQGVGCGRGRAYPQRVKKGVLDVLVVGFKDESSV